MVINQERITPAMAQEYLKFNTENYRSVNNLRVMTYANDMKAGKWQLNGEGIKFDSNGVLLDGQHRLQAIVKAGVPVDMLVVRDIQPGMNVYDIGSTRSLGQIAKARGAVNAYFSSVIAAAAWVVNDGGHQNLSGKISTLEYAEKNSELLTKAVRLAVMGASSPICKKAAIIAAVYCLMRNGVSGSDIGDFFRVANTGIPSGHYDPSSACIFRNMVQVNKSRSQEERQLLFSATISAIQDFIAGKPRVKKYTFQPETMEMLQRVRLEDGLADS